MCGIVAFVRLLSGITLFVLCCARASAAFADQSDNLIQHGLELRRAGDDEGALPIFERAYELHATSRAAAQLGLCEMALGRFAEADGHLTEALRSADPWVTRNRAALQDADAEAKKKVGRLEVLGEPRGAQVMVNGRIAGTLPLAGPVRLTAGNADVEVRAPGFATMTRSFVLAGGQFQSAVFNLVASNSSEDQGLSTGARPRSLVPANGSESGRESTGSMRSRWKWISWGGALAASGVGIYGVIRHASKLNDFNAHCGFVGDRATSTGDSLNDDQCADLASSYRTGRTFAIVGLASSGLLALTGLALYLTEPSGSGREASFTCSTFAHAYGATCRYTF